MRELQSSVQKASGYMESSFLRIDPHVEVCGNKKSLVGMCQVLGRDNVKRVLKRPTIIEVH